MRVLLEKWVREFPALYGIGSFITVFKRTLILSQMNSVHFPYEPLPYFLPSGSRSSECSLPFRLSNQNFLLISPCHVHIILLDLLNLILHIWCRIPVPVAVPSKRRSWPLSYWNREFESRPGHECLSVCFCVVLSCVSRGLCDGPIARPKGSYSVSKIKIKNPKKGETKARYRL
jgi:hypothetical protein